MSSVPSEPEKYSIDEMMDRLKNGPSGDPEEGELVTRADGTQAIRVRKRKRRSKQPQKEQSKRVRRARILRMSLALMLLFLAIFTVGAGVVYSNSSSYREGLIQQIHQSSGAEASLETFRMNPTSASAGKLTLQWPEGNALKSLVTKNLTAGISLSSFLGNSFSGEEIVTADAVLTLGLPEEGKPARLTPPPAVLPIDFNRYRATSFEFALGEPTKSPFKLLKSEAVLTPLANSGQTQVSLYKGDLFVAGWPKLRMDRALAEFRDDEIDIISLRLLHERDDRGSIEFSGLTYPLKPKQRSTLAVEMKSFDISGLTGPTLGRLVSGRVDSQPAAKSNFLSFSPRANPELVMDATFVSTPGSTMDFRGFPFLFALSQLLGDNWFEHPMFEGESRGVLHHENGAFSLRDLEFQAKNRLALRGEITMAAKGTLSGTIRLGLTDAMVTTAVTPGLHYLFGPVSDGYRWVDLEISGTAVAPADNFKELFSQTAKQPDTILPGSHTTPSGSNKSTFEELTK